MFKKILILAIMSVLTTTVVAWNPKEPIEIVVPYAPGGSTDKWGRTVSDIFNEHGWKSHVTNRPGADTTIASNYVARSRPDGTVLYLCGMGFRDANLSFKSRPEGIQYNVNSFTDIAPLGHGTLVLVANQTVPVNNYAEFKQFIQANPDKFTLGFFNQYIANLFYVWANKEKLSKPTIVMYKGSSPLLVDLVGGQVPFAFDTYNTVEPFIKSGRVKILAVLDTSGLKIIQRNDPKFSTTVIGRQIPEVDMSVFYGLCGPANMPKEIVRAINSVVNQGLQNPKHAKPILDMNMSVQGGPPEALEKYTQNLQRLFDNIAKEIQ